MTFFKHKDREDKVVVETVKPVEVPVITTVKQCLVRNNYGEAVRYGYQAALYDFQRAHGLVFPPIWSNRDILERGFKGVPGYLPALFAQLYKLYEPVRFGQAASWTGAEGDVVGILQSIYSDGSLWRLYAHRVATQGNHPVNGPNAYKLLDTDIQVARPAREGPVLPGEHRLVQSSLLVRKEDRLKSPH